MLSALNMRDVVLALWSMRPYANFGVIIVVFLRLDGLIFEIDFAAGSANVRA